MLEKNKIRLLVVPIVAVLVVTMFVAGNWQQSEEQIDVDEGYDEVTVSYPESYKNVSIPDKTATAVSWIDDKYTLRLNLTVHSVVLSPDLTEVTSLIDIESNLSADYDIDYIKLVATDLKNISETAPEFDTSWNSGENVVFWSAHKNVESSHKHAHIGFDLKDSTFCAKTRLTYFVFNSNQESHSFEFEAIIGGPLENIEATIEVTIE